MAGLSVGTGLGLAALFGMGASMYGSNKASEAADAQLEAAGVSSAAMAMAMSEANQVQMQMYGQTRADMAPWRAAGSYGLEQLIGKPIFADGTIGGSYQEDVPDGTSNWQNFPFDMSDREDTPAKYEGVDGGPYTAIIPGQDPWQTGDMGDPVSGKPLSERRDEYTAGEEQRKKDFMEANPDWTPEDNLGVETHMGRGADLVAAPVSYDSPVNTAIGSAIGKPSHTSPGLFGKIESGMQDYLQTGDMGSPVSGRPLSERRNEYTEQQKQNPVTNDPMSESPTTRGAQSFTEGPTDYAPNDFPFPDEPAPYKPFPGDPAPYNQRQDDAAPYNPLPEDIFPYAPSEDAAIHNEGKSAEQKALEAEWIAGLPENDPIGKDKEITGYTGGLLQEGPGEFESSPGYQFRMDEGIKALDRGAAASGRLGSGAASKDLLRFSQGLASNEYQSFLNQYYQSLTPWQSLAGIGQTATSQTGAAGQDAANAMSSNYMAGGQGQAQAAQYGGDARASGYQNQANFMTGGANNIMQIIGMLSGQS